eukprot:768358-Hanusia_phi.AAC.5
MKKSSIFLAMLVIATHMAAHQMVHGAIPPIKQDSFKEFHIVKNVDDSQEVTLDSHTCQFTYRAMNSAHGELWRIELQREHGQYTCIIEDQDKNPPHASFLGFSAHLVGAKDNALSMHEVWNHQVRMGYE